jgi:hypothetical protein
MPLSPPNGKIHTSVRLACALRYSAGGSPYDIMSTYGISNTEQFDSVHWGQILGVLLLFFLWYGHDLKNNCEQVLNDGLFSEGTSHIGFNCRIVASAPNS